MGDPRYSTSRLHTLHTNASEHSVMRLTIVQIAVICYLSLGNTSEFSDEESILKSDLLGGPLVESVVPEEDISTRQVSALFPPELEEIQTTKGHLEGVIDDPSDSGNGDHDDGGVDKNLHDRNKSGLNKLTGGRHYTSHTLDGNGNVKPPGYTVDQARTGKHGYYLGPSRRRIGAGFGRRRNVPFVIPKSWKASGAKLLKKYKHSGRVKILVGRRRRAHWAKKKLPKKWIRGFHKKVVVHVKKAFKKVSKHVKHVVAAPSLHFGKKMSLKKHLKKAKAAAKKAANKVKKAAAKIKKKAKKAKAAIKHIYSGAAGHYHRIVMPNNMKKSKLLKGLLKKMKAHKRV